MSARLKPYPAYRDSGVPWLGEVPEHWECERLKNMAFNTVELTPTARPGDLYLALEHVESWTGRIRPPQGKVTFDSQVKRFRVNDVLFGKLRPYLAKVALPNAPGVCVGEFFVMHPRSGDVSSAYLANLLRSKHVIDVVNSSTFGAKMPRADWNFVGNVILAFPPLPEQAAIVRYLDHIDRLIRRYIRAKQCLIALLNEQKQAIIHRAVTRGLDPNVRLKPSGVEWLGEVPEHWEVVQIGHLARLGNGSTPSRGNPAYWTSDGYPWLNSASVTRGRIADADQFVTDLALRECHLPRVPAGSVLVAITGQGKTRGTAAVLDVEATINQHIVYITPRAEVVSAGYMRFCLMGAYRALRAISDDSGSTKGALTCRDIRHFKIAVASIDEQYSLVNAIERKILDIEVAVHRAQREIELMREYRTRLIADVVTGKVDVRDVAASLPEDEEEQAPEEADDTAEVEDPPDPGEAEDEGAEG